MGMGTTGYEPKFPPSETDFHHLHHHGGYGAMNGIATNHVDYSYHNGYNYGNYAASPTTPFYHHHPPYASPHQMHHSANTPSPQASSYVTNVLSNNNNSTSNVPNRNNSTTSSAVPNIVPNGLNISENSTPNVDNSIGYYNNYYSNTNGHHLPQDVPIQCPSTEPPANTALGLQELGMNFILLRVASQRRHMCTFHSSIHLILFVHIYISLLLLFFFVYC
jgi:homeobox protein HoxA/B/C/D4